MTGPPLWRQAFDAAADLELVEARRVADGHLAVRVRRADDLEQRPHAEPVHAAADLATLREARLDA